MLLRLLKLLSPITRRSIIDTPALLAKAAITQRAYPIGDRRTFEPFVPFTRLEKYSNPHNEQSRDYHSDTRTFINMQDLMNDEDTPRRGGTGHLGVYVGGAPLLTTFELDPNEHAYKHAMQLRSAKTLLSIEAQMMAAAMDASRPKFNGRLKLTDADNSTLSELDKESFLLEVDDLVQTYGFQSFFYMPDAENGEMVYLVTDPHRFTLEEVLGLHIERLYEPDPDMEVLEDEEGNPVIDDETGEVVLQETTESIERRFLAYDKFERYDFALSRRAVEMTITKELLSTIRIKYGHTNGFRALPGQILFMMALDVSNASAMQDIDEASDLFKALTLASYPGENIVDFATEAQRLIKIMKTSYALPYTIGSELLAKVDNTESKYFNQQVFKLQEVVKRMERSVGPQKDPKLLTKHRDFPTHGPLSLCATLQVEYGELKKNREWPALRETRPEGNNAGAVQFDSDGHKKNADGKRCFKCQSEFHLMNDPTCPFFKAKNSSPNQQNKSTTGNDGDGGGTVVKGTAAAPANVWKYIHPADENQVLEVNGKTFYFCKKCVCHSSGRVGFYNLTHSTKDHKSGVGKKKSEQGNGSGAAQGNLSSAVRDSDPPLEEVEDVKSEAEAKKKTGVPEESGLDEDEVDPAPDGLEFVGAHLSQAFDDEADLWMCPINEEDGDELANTDEPVVGAIRLMYCNNCAFLGPVGEACPCGGEFSCNDPPIAFFNRPQPILGPLITTERYCNLCDRSGELNMDCSCGGSFTQVILPTQEGAWNNFLDSEAAQLNAETHLDDESAVAPFNTDSHEESEGPNTSSIQSFVTPRNRSDSWLYCEGCNVRGPANLSCECGGCYQFSERYSLSPMRRCTRCEELGPTGLQCDCGGLFDLRDFESPSISPHEAADAPLPSPSAPPIAEPSSVPSPSASSNETVEPYMLGRHSTDPINCPLLLCYTCGHVGYPEARCCRCNHGYYAYTVDEWNALQPRDCDNRYCPCKGELGGQCDCGGTFVGPFIPVASESVTTNTSSSNNEHKNSTTDYFVSDYFSPTCDKDPFVRDTTFALTSHRLHTQHMYLLFLVWTFNHVVKKYGVLTYCLTRSILSFVCQHLLLMSINKCHNTIVASYNYTLFVGLCSLALFWDTIDLFTTATPSTSNNCLRQSHFPRLHWYPRRWMILSAYMVTAFGSHVTHPASIIYSQLHSTTQRMDRITQLVHLSPTLLYDYHNTRRDDIYRPLPLAESSSLPSIESDLEFHELPSTWTMDFYFDALESFADSEPTCFFFNSSSSYAALEGEKLSIDFADSHSWDHEDTLDKGTLDSKFNPFALEDLCVPHTYLACDQLQCDIDTPVLSPKAYTAALMGTVDLHPRNMPESFQVIFDTGASLAISPSLDDFSGPITKFSTDRRLGGMANGLKIEGIGIVQWSFRSRLGIITVRSKCYYVPEAKARLISPQRLFCRSEGVTGKFTAYEDKAVLTFDNVGELDIEYDTSSHLPIALAKNLSLEGAQGNLCILNEFNQNLTPAQKLLLFWHARFGHKGFKAIQQLFRHIPFATEKFIHASRCDIPRCEVCQYAKSSRKNTKGNSQSTNRITEGAVRADSLQPGAKVSVDHFESRLKGRTLTSFGKTTSDQYVGGCIFVDSMSGYMHVEHQLGFSSSETIRAKQSFEKMALDCGVVVDTYMADNGAFKARAFVQHIREAEQRINYCGVNAHHQNGVAERAIRTVSECARALLLHSSLRWKSGIDSTLWPMAVDYAVYLYNHLPNQHGIAPADLFTGATIPRHKLRECHTWGCPVYVLDPVLQQNKKLPRWQPRSRRGVFVGFSKIHSSDVPLILNLQTGSISPQYHVVFDDSFTTVSSLKEDEEPPKFWNEVDLENHTHQVPLEPDETVELHKDWLTAEELEEQQRRNARRNRIRQNLTNQSDLSAKERLDGTRSYREKMDHASTSTGQKDTSNEIIDLTDTSHPNSKPEGGVSTPEKRVRWHDSGTGNSNTTSEAVIKQEPTSPSSLSQPTTSPSPVAAPPGDTTAASSPPRRVSSRRNKGRFDSWRYDQMAYCDKVFLTSILDESKSEYQSELSYKADIDTDFDHGISYCTDPRAYAAKHKLGDPDLPSYNEAMTGQHAEEYTRAMIKEIRQLVKQKTWEPVPRNQVPRTANGSKRPVLKGTWAFKLKRLPDGSPSKFKARYCVRGDLQKEGIDFFETYAPVVQWSTVRMLLTLVLAHGWTTKQVDYTNAFAQATLKEEVYIEPPRGFNWKKKTDMVLKLIKSLYGLRQAPKTFFDKLKEGLLERGFVQSELDPCLFMRDKIMIVVYVDDTIIAGPNEDEINEIIKGLGVQTDDQQHRFELRDEGQVGDFLGIRIEKKGNGAFKLSQPGLIAKALKAANMETANTAPTPASTTPLAIDTEGDPFNEPWEYASIIGMLMYLATNSRPDIAYAVHSCARFTHCPRNSHAKAVKRILRYLKGTQDKGLVMTPSTKLNVNCYVDADFAGLWRVENDQDPVSVKSRSGHLITFMDCPLLWSSKLQTQIALSTMEAEYIALSNSMRDLIAIREILKEITQHVLKSIEQPTYATIAKTFGGIPKSKVFEDNEACLKFARMPKMTSRTKHIAIPYHFFRSKVKELEIEVLSINTNDQLADQFTKGLPEDSFIEARKRLMGW